jgi:hypothetical protein
MRSPKMVQLISQARREKLSLLFFAVLIATTFLF